MPVLIGQFVAGYSLVNLVIVVIIVAVVVAIFLVAMNKLGFTVPDWIRQIGFYIFVGLVAIIAIRIVAGMLGYV